MFKERVIFDSFGIDFDRQPAKTKCPVCGRLTDPKAEACEHCKTVFSDENREVIRKNQEQAKHKGIAVGLVFAVLVAFVVIIFG